MAEHKHCQMSAGHEMDGQKHRHKSMDKNTDIRASNPHPPTPGGAGVGWGGGGLLLQYQNVAQIPL